MKWKHLFSTSYDGLRTNKKRSFLTILGIVIGVTSIILIIAMGEAAKNLIITEIQGIGTKTLIIIPGRQIKGPADIAQTFGDSLGEKDLKLLQKKELVPHAKKIMPLLFGAKIASFRGETYQVTLLGGSQDMRSIFNLKTGEGDFFSDEDVSKKNQVAVIGEEVKKNLFKNVSPLGENVRIGEKKFTVVGILQSKGQGSFANFDDSIILPYSSMKDYILGIDYFNRIVVETDDEKNIRATVADLEITLRNGHGITDPEKDDFFIESPTSIANRLKTITDTLTFFLAAVAGISLLVGGIGIMNIMLVSVTERTQEIGLRKALGATSNIVLTQFLLEAVMITSLGGIFGILLGATAALLISVSLQSFAHLNWHFIFPTSAAMLGIAFSTLIGIVFGLYPARKAAQKDPIEAMRFE